MERTTGYQDHGKGRGMIPLSKHPLMDRLEKILRDLPEDRHEAFTKALEDRVTNEQPANYQSTGERHDTAKG